MKCNCLERSIDEVNEHDKFTGNRVPLPEGDWTHLHNCEYVRRRGALVRSAEATVLYKHEDKIMKLEPSEGSALFNREFSREMERLVKENGI